MIFTVSSVPKNYTYLISYSWKRPPTLPADPSYLNLIRVYFDRKKYAQQKPLTDIHTDFISNTIGNMRRRKFPVSLGYHTYSHRD